MGRISHRRAELTDGRGQSLEYIGVVEPGSQKRMNVNFGIRIRGCLFLHSTAQAGRYLVLIDKKLSYPENLSYKSWYRQNLSDIS